MDLDSSQLAKGEIVWGKPEQTAARITTWALLAAGGVGLFWFWGVIVPFVVATLANTLLAGLYGAGILLFAFLATNKRVRTLFSYIGRSLFRGVASFMAETDPIGILRNHAEDGDEKLQTIDAQISKLAGVIRSAKQAYDANEKERTDNLFTLQAAKKRPPSDANRESMFLAERQIGRMEQLNGTLKVGIDRMEGLYKLLSKLRSHVSMMVKDMYQDIDARERSYKAINASFGAISAVSSILKGGGSERELYEMAIRHLDENWATKLGAIDDFMNSNAGLLNNLDLQNGIFEERALKALEEMENKSTMLLGDGQHVEAIYEEPGAHDDVLSLFKTSQK